RPPAIAIGREGDGPAAGRDGARQRHGLTARVEQKRRGRLSPGEGAIVVEEAEVRRVLVERHDDADAEALRVAIEGLCVERVQGAAEERNAVELLDQTGDRPGPRVTTVR